jgi:DNA/RNA endonuclease G (NUC1)
LDGNRKVSLKYAILSVWYNKLRKAPFISTYNIHRNLEKKKVARKDLKMIPE